MKKKYNEDEDEISTIQEKDNPMGLKELIEKYFLIPWKWYMLSVLIAGVIGFLYVRSQSLVYTANTTMLIKNPSEMANSDAMSVASHFGRGSAISASVSNEKEILVSQVLIERVVNYLELHTTYKTKSFLRSQELYNYTPYTVQLDSLSLNRMLMPAALIIEYNKEKDVYAIKGDYEGQAIKTETKVFPVHIKLKQGIISIYEHKDGNTAFNLLKNKKITVGILNPRQAAKNYSGNIFAYQKRGTDVVVISTNSNNSRKTVEILNTLTEVFNIDAIEQVLNSSRKTMTFIDDRMAIIAGELSEVEMDAQYFKQQQGIIDVNSNSNMSLSRSERYDARTVEAEMQLSMIRHAESFVSNPANNYSMIPDLGITDPSLSAVLRQYNDYVMERSRLADMSTLENPQLKRLDNQLVLQREAIKVGIANNRVVLEMQKREVGNQYSIAQSKIHTAPVQQREFLEIQRQQQVKQQLYLYLLQKKEEAALKMAVPVEKGRVLIPADTASIIGTGTKQALFIALCAGLAIPLLIISLIDWLDNTIKSRSEVEKISKVSVLSELGHNYTDNIIIEHENTRNSDAELFRLLRNRIQFVLKSSPDKKVILVTSTEPGEGKSYTAINLALSLNFASKKVALVGMDMRKPGLAKHFGLDSAKEGVSSYLADSTLNWRDLLLHKDEYKNLDILCAGAVPPNPNELLMSERLDVLLNEMRREYDYIVIDSAPIGAVSDTLLIARTADLTLYMTRVSYSDKANLVFLNRLAEDKSINNPYIVLNDMRLESRYYYHRGYGYAYAYAYGYGYGNKGYGSGVYGQTPEK